MPRKSKHAQMVGLKALATVQKFFSEVVSVDDASKDVTVEVTKADNQNGMVKSHKTCAMAVCVKRTLKADGVIIAVRTAYVVYGDKAVRYRLPESIAREIVSFDRKAGFAVGTYKLNAPCKSEKLGHPSGDHSNRNGNRPPGKFRFMHHTSGIRTVLGASGITD